MRKKFTFLSIVFLLVFLFTFNINTAFADEKIYLGGMPAGFSLTTRGAEIVGICDVVGRDGVCSPAKDAGLEVGDVILNIDDNEINSAADIEKSVNNKIVQLKILQ